MRPLGEQDAQKRVKLTFTRKDQKMNVKQNFPDRCRSLTQDMLTALRTGDDHAYDGAAAEARALIEAQAATHLAGMTSTRIVDQDGPVRPVYAAAIAAYAAAQTPHQIDRKFDELCLIRADEIISETGDPDPDANLFEIYDIDGQVTRILIDCGIQSRVQEIEA